MSYCLKAACLYPQNHNDVNYCLGCGSYLLLQKRYRILKQIGQGGMGRTFLAVDESYPSKPRCVIKQFFPQNQSINNQRKASALFCQEALRLETLGKHPQIPELLNYFEWDGQQYLVQEFIDGQNLEQELAEAGAFNETQIRQLLSDLLPVLRFVHDHQIIHRDIKPANIIRRFPLDERGRGDLVLVDFGAAKYVTSIALAQTGTMIGSAEYIAPEQIRGKAVFASDLYSLGVTCIHLLTQIPPFDVFDSSENAWVWRCYLGCPVSQSLGQVFDKLLQNATKWRYQSAEAVLRDLNSEPIQLLPASLLTIEIGSTDIKQLSDTVPANHNDSSLPVTPVFSATVFEPKTQSWHRLPNLFEHSESVWAVAPFLRPQVASVSATCNNKLTPQVTSTNVTQKRRESPWSALEAIWLTTIWLAIFICLAIGLKLKQPSPYLEVKHSNFRILEDTQPIRPSPNLGLTN